MYISSEPIEVHKKSTRLLWSPIHGAEGEVEAHRRNHRKCSTRFERQVSIISLKATTDLKVGVAFRKSWHHISFNLAQTGG